MTLLIRISCGHTNLAIVELKAYFRDKLTSLASNIFQVDANKELEEKYLDTSAGCKIGGDLIFLEEPPITEEKLLIRCDEFIKSNQLFLGSTFRVRVYKNGNLGFSINRNRIERKIGSIVLNRNSNVSVNLSNPESEVGVIIWETGFGLIYTRNCLSAGDFSARSPKVFPYFRGGAIKPRIARFLVNLLSPENDQLIIDPFAGHGGLLIELASLGISSLGIELDRKIVREAQVNLLQVRGSELTMIIMGDSLHMPLRKLGDQKFVTDPPYAIQTTTSGREPAVLFMKWLLSLSQTCQISFSLPNNVLEQLPTPWKVVLEAEDFVHKNLTRRLRVITNG